MDQHSFLFQAMIYLAAAVVMVPLAKRLGLGSVLGYLLAGILIGPSVFRFIGEEGEDIMHFAEFGVVMMLFIIGLELEPSRLWNLRKSILGLGGLQVILTATIIFGVALALGLRWQEAFVLGMILSLSSTAIVLQYLNEKGMLKTYAGQSSFSVLLFQDIAVIPMLALFPLLSGTAESAADPGNMVSGLPAWMQAAVIFLAIIAIMLSGRFLIRPLFRVVARTRLRELFTATALLIVVAIAVLMTAVGLSAALGTFLAGVVLANSEYKHEMESDIEPFKGLLLGLFFITVGASIDFDLVMRQPETILLLVAGLMFLKTGVLFLLGRFFSLDKGQNLWFALGLSQMGEFAFVLFSFTAEQQILSPSLTDTMVAVVAISMALTPLILLLNERLVQPRLVRREADAAPGMPDIGEQHEVIVAGFGHFGNTTGRFLRAHRVGMTVLDNNADRVELLRRMGFKVYYGDASRLDLLQAAGAARAKLIIIALEPASKRLEMIETIKKHFPNLRMLVRAANRYDAYDLMNAGMLHVYRESLDTSLRMGVDVMRFLGYRAYTAQRAARTFLKIDEANLKKLASIKDREEYIISARENIEELERMLQADAEQFRGAVDRGWDEESLMADAHKMNPS